MTPSTPSYDSGEISSPHYLWILIQWRVLYQAPPPLRIQNMGRVNLYYFSYFFQILKERIYPQSKRHYLMWNTPPGGLFISPTFSHTLKNYPFYVNTLSENPADKFTAIIVAVTPVSKPTAPLFKLIQVINNCKHVDQVNWWDYICLQYSVLQRSCWRAIWLCLFAIKIYLLQVT